MITVCGYRSGTETPERGIGLYEMREFALTSNNAKIMWLKYTQYEQSIQEKIFHGSKIKHTILVLCTVLFPGW